MDRGHNREHTSALYARVIKAEEAWMAAMVEIDHLRMAIDHHRKHKGDNAMPEDMALYTLVDII